jgi:hypothetical protein
MSTVDSVFLIITGCAISLFFLLGAVVLIFVLKLIKQVKRVVAKAEDAIDSVEAATETIKNIGVNASGPLAVFKVVKNIVDLVNRRK